MKIHFVTTNSGKVASMQRNLDKAKIKIIQEKINLIEPRSSDVKEIAKSKINEAYPQIKKPTMILDAGFYIKSLNGFPKAYVNFTLNTIGIEGILKLVKDKPRECEFQECIAYLDETLNEPKYFIRHIKGTLSDKPKGVRQKHHWSDLALIFIPQGGDKTLGEMSLDEYSKYTERNIEKDKLALMLNDALKNFNEKKERNR